MSRLVVIAGVLASSAALAQPVPDPPPPEPVPEPEPVPVEPAPEPPPPVAPAPAQEPVPPPAPPPPATAMSAPVADAGWAPPPIAQSMLPNLFATSVGTTVEVRLDYSDVDGIDLTIVNTYARVQHLTPQGFGGYVAVPFGFVEEDDSLLGDLGGSAVGNVEVGGLLVTRASERTDVLVRGGVSIDTTSEDDDVVILLSTTLPRLVDLFPSALQTTWGRGQAQLRFASNNLRLGAALGADVPIAGDGADEDGFTGIVNGILAAGIQQGNIGLGASYVLVAPISDDDDESITGLNLSGDYLMNPNARVVFTIGFSLEDDGGGNSFGLGVRWSSL